MNLHLNNLKKVTHQLEPALINFAQKLVQIPSLPGHEAVIAKVIQKEMKRLGYDEVAVDDCGNVIGYIKGQDGPTIMFNGHMDHVDPGDEASWPYPPFSGQIFDGALWGRGSVDMKGPLAGMIYMPAVIKSTNLIPPGDIYVVASVMEELGGLGSSYLVTRLKTDLAVIGEPSGNTLRRGHRGRVEMWITIAGKSTHASIPHQGVNPHYTIANFLSKLQGLDMVKDETFGPSSVAPTLYHSDQNSPNVTPGQIRLTLDWRNIPSEPPEEILQKVDKLLQQSLLEGVKGSVTLATRPFTTYTGITIEHSAVFPSFVLEPTDPLLIQARQTLTQALEREVPLDIWRFATDGGHLMANGIPTIGFGPGDETLAHTNQEHLEIQALNEAFLGYTALALTEWPHKD
jgi:putative selenium metabolism hydrolase